MRVPCLPVRLQTISFSLASLLAKNPNKVSPDWRPRLNMPLGWSNPSRVPCPPLIMQTATSLKKIYLRLCWLLGFQFLRILWIEFSDPRRWRCWRQVKIHIFAVPWLQPYRGRHADIVAQLVDSRLIWFGPGMQPSWLDLECCYSALWGGSARIALTSRRYLPK